MKIKDGFKFGVGFLIAYDLYKTIVHLDDVIKATKRGYKTARNNGFRAAMTELSNSASNITTKNKIGFTIE